MRNQTTVIIAGAVALVVAIALYMGAGGPTAESTDGVQAPQKARPAGAAQDQGAGQARMVPEGDDQGQGSDDRRARVQERLERLRSDSEQRRVDQVTAQKRDLPDLPKAKRDEADDEDNEPDPEDEELKQTILNDPDPEERASAVFMLSGAEDKDTLRVLMQAMDDSDAEVRLAVVEALGDYSEEISADVVTPALRDGDPEVRFEAVGVLGDMDTPEALEAVRGALNDEDPDVRELAEGIIEMAEDDSPKMPPAANKPAGAQKEQMKK